MDHNFELKLSKHNLILASVNPEDAGRYSISAKNAAGFSNTKFEIIVNQPPKFEIKPPITHSGTVEFSSFLEYFVLICHAVIMNSTFELISQSLQAKDCNKFS